VFKRARIAILLLILAYVGVSALTARARIASWERPVRVAVFTIAADDSPATRAYLESLDAGAFADVERFFAEEASRHGLRLARPVELRHAGRLDTVPPPAPVNGSRLDAILWSLHLRWWVWRHGGDGAQAAQVRLFVLHHDPARVSTVPHSVGLSKGLVGVVHVFSHRSAGEPERHRPRTRTAAHPRGRRQVRPGGESAHLPRRLRRTRPGTATSPAIRGDHGWTHTAVGLRVRDAGLPGRCAHRRAHGCRDRLGEESLKALQGVRLHAASRAPERPSVRRPWWPAVIWSCVRTRRPRSSPCSSPAGQS